MEGASKTRLDGPDLYIHIGLPKTGTKWVQKILGVNRDWLESEGIRYTLPPYEDPGNGQILTQGNAGDLFAPDSDVETILERCEFDGERSLFLSSEKIFRNLIDFEDAFPGLLERDIQKLKIRGFRRIFVLVFVRSPLEWQVSNFNQHYKRKALINFSYEYLWSLYERNSLNKVVNVLERLATCEDISLRVIRYDPIGGNLLTKLSGILGVDAQKFQLPAFPRVNRSHSYSELYILQQLRLSGVDNTELISLSLEWMSALPDLKVEPFYPFLAFQEAYWAKNETVLDRLNGFLPEDEHFSPQFYTPFEPPEQLEFAPVQLDVLLRFLSERSLKLEI